MNHDRNVGSGPADAPAGSPGPAGPVDPFGADADPGGTRGSRLRRGRMVGGVAAAVLLAGVLWAIGGPADPGGTGTPGRDDPSGEQDRAILEALPRSAIDGKESWRLPVVARPQSGIEAGDTITLYGRGFEPNESLGIVHCSSEADTANAGIGACELADGAETYGNVDYASASNEGTVVARVRVRRFITTPNGGRIDCAAAAERCLIGIGAIDNYDRSGGTYINFADAPPFPEPSLTVAPDDELSTGQQVEVRAAGLLPGRPAVIEQCVGDRCTPLAGGKVAADGTYATSVTVGAKVIDDRGEIACEDRCTLRLTGIGVEGASAAPFPEPWPIRWAPAPTTTSIDPTTSTTTSDATGSSATVPPTTFPTPTTLPGREPSSTATTTVPPTTTAPPTTAGPAG